MKKLVVFLSALPWLLATLAYAQSENQAEDEDSQLLPKITTVAELEGLWEVHSIYDKFQPFEVLFPGKKPRLYFDMINQQILGYTGCNNFSIFTHLQGNEIDVMGFLGMTKAWCDGDGEDIFLTLLKSAHTFAISDEGHLTFLCGNLEIMRLEKVDETQDDHPFGPPTMLTFKNPHLLLAN
ncbi:MAG: META domain-containing protein [Lunatimonas sp.]|uniref:META domain-containing protein n=1 Tax=Lunatimonas sp. TaxID=2060141 RepID=UPI00263B77F1|nr:META domain-containing protein [Lunatimonas sp.]MCC5936633.1 META domain-containing protein [Lunatimonas sp.]